MPEYYPHPNPRQPGEWEVAKFDNSDSPVAIYHVRRGINGKWKCDCPHASFRHTKCKHILIVEAAIAGLALEF